MILKTFVLSFSFVIPALSLVSADTMDPTASSAGMSSSNSGTVSTGTSLVAPAVSPGRYTASVMPSINHDMSNRLEDSLKKLDGVTNVVAKTDDSSIHFTVKNGAKVHLADIQQVVTSIDSGAVMTAPVLEHSMAANPGL